MAFAIVAAAAACQLSSTSDFALEKAAGDTPGEPAAGSSFAGADAASDAHAHLGLCNFQAGSTCDPDEDQKECVPPGLAPEAGGAEAGIDAGPATDAARPPSLGCHVSLNAAGAGIPGCSPAGTGKEGASCNLAQDCALGFECSSDGVCRHYCCDGKCESLTFDGKATFCDVQRTKPYTPGVGCPP